MNNKVVSETLTIEKRRYIGCKAKLVSWITGVIKELPGVHSFCDIFAGTAVVSSNLITHFDRVYINDFLHSNNVIYTAFFEDSDCDDRKLINIIDNYNQIKSETLVDNYFSINYGGKFFDYDTSKKIGFIRQDIENIKEKLTWNEYCILITSLIYAMDRIANTIGHYEAYIKKEIKPQSLVIKLIDYKRYKNVTLFKQDANILAKSIKADVVYIDPPYNSRQYSRFYHVYETLVKWDMPELYGTAMKPAEENMSAYCSSKAPIAFADLIQSLDTKYIVVSYNNTYNSKSKSSQNKISLEQILEVLNAKGETKVLEHKHQYFNAGKTQFDNHKELLFVTKVNG